MNSYTDTRIIECARLHSEEALSGNDENYSLWTNNLTDIIHLDPGDQVSLHGAMVSERGAGQSQSIEIKGESLGFKKTFTFIETKSLGNACEDIPVGNTYLSSNVSSKEVDMRDDTAVFQISYYITADGHNYIQLPRRFWWRDNASPQSLNFTNQDIGVGSTSSQDSGRSLWDPFNASQGTSNTYADPLQYFDDFYQHGDNRYAYCNQLNNGRRYTLMIRDNSYYSEESASGNLPQRYLRDPENAVYHRYTEVKEIQVDKGFNSPDYIATDVTRKLQDVLEEKTFEVRVPDDLTYNASRPGFPIKQYKTYTTETYKPFDVAWIYSTDIKADFGHYINNGSAPNNGSGYGWLSQYHITACLRPELYETGRLINMSGDEDRGILGAELKQAIAPASLYIITSILYQKEYIDKFRDFIRAQEKYPEIFDILQDSRTPYNNDDNFTNCRFFHMNRYDNASSTLDPTDASGVKAQLGWGGYVQPSWRSNTTPLQLGAVLVPFVYDDAQRDQYYDDPNDNLNQLTYGCFAKETIGGVDYLKVKMTPYNMYFNPLFEKYLRQNAREGAPGLVEAGRKLGFDLHFNSMGNCWILPFSGHTPRPNSFNGAAALISFSRMFANQQMIDSHTASGQYNVLFPHLSRLYVGADSPKLNWDGTHFSFSDLHTALNRGNDIRADVPWQIGRIGDVTALDSAGDVVYKINPAEQYSDWSPVRMPYVDHKTLYTNASHIPQYAYEVNAFNTNLTPWQIYDAPCGIFIEDFNLTEDEWEGSFWSRLGFSYRQFHNPTNTRLDRIQKGNANYVSVLTTNSEVDEGDTKIQIQNLFKAPMYTTMIPRGGTLKSIDEGSPTTSTDKVAYLPEIIQKTESIKLIADNLPTRMIRGYYTIRTNILQDNPFIGGKKNNTIMPIIAVIDKINGDGDFYFQQDSSLVFTITKPLRLASITCSINDPDGSLANTNEQNTILFKVVKQKQVTFNVLQELLQQQQGNQPRM